MRYEFRVDGVMSDEARAILDAGRETLERTADIKVGHHHRGPDALESWRRGMPEPEPAPVRRKLMTDAVEARLMAEIDRRVAAALAEERKISNAVHAEVLVSERKQYRVEIDSLRRENDKLQRQFSEFRSVMTEYLEATASLQRALLGDDPTGRVMAGARRRLVSVTSLGSRRAG